MKPALQDLVRLASMEFDLRVAVARGFQMVWATGEGRHLASRTLDVEVVA